MSKSCLITGITGQDASFLSELLLSKGYVVHGLVRRVAVDRLDNIHHLISNTNFHLHYGDMATENHLCWLIHSLLPDEIYNLAGQSDVAASFDIPEYTGDVTGLGVTRLLEAVRLFSPKSKVYQASSSEMFGNAPAPQNELTPLTARSPYACFPANTTVVVKGGYRGFTSKRIDQIKVGDEVLSYDNKSGRKELDVVIDVMSRDVNKLYTFELSNGNKIICSEEHPFYVPQIGWVRADHLKVGNNLLQFKYIGLSLRIKGFLMKGKTYRELYGSKSFEICDKLSKANKGKHKDRLGKTYPEIYGVERAKQILINKTGKVSPLKGRIRPNISAAKKGKPAWNKGKKTGRIPWNKGLTANTDPRVAALVKKSGIAMKKLWKDIEFIKKQLKARHQCPNKQEILLQDILEEVCLGEFAYNGGCELGIMINRKIPDFVNINGKKKVVEFFGEYWHNKPYKESESTVKRKYKEMGFDCLVVWGKELADVKKLKEKLQNFVYNPNTVVVEVVSITIKQCQTMVFNIETRRNHNYFAHGILVHNCAKIYAHNMVRCYREAYGMFACSGILSNHESERRGLNFVTRKISNAVARIYLGKQDKLVLGNIDAKRDWGYAPDFVRAMWLMLQQDEPDDFVIGTGETHTVEDFLEIAFKVVELDWRDYTTYDSPDFNRPSDITCLVADPSKAKRVLGWEAKVKFPELVEIMVKYDLQLEAGK